MTGAASSLAVLKHALRGLVIRGGNRVSSYLIPKRSRLPFRYWLHLLGDCENELRYLSKIVPSTAGIAIDVGANNGMFSYAMSKMFSVVYSFEINDNLTQDLQAYNPGNIKIVGKGLSSQKGEAILYIPVINDTPLTGWASIDPNNCPGAQELIEKPVEIITLDAYMIQPVSFIKIDVEGHEVEALKGALRTIASDRPRVLIEVKDKNLDEVRSFFGELNYQEQSLYDLIGIEGSQENLIFVPSNKT